ncbi:4484_t:CDS:2, partial [Dentiscutata erythropus]
MRGSFSDMFIKDTINWVDRSSPPSSPVLDPKKGIQILAPTQGDSFVSEYIKIIKLYAIAIGKNLDDIDIKVKFFIGLSPDNKKQEDMSDIDNREGEDNLFKSPHKRSFMNTSKNKSPSKKAKKQVKKENSLTLKKLIQELTSPTYQQ